MQTKQRGSPDPLRITERAQRIKRRVFKNPETETFHESSNSTHCRSPPSLATCAGASPSNRTAGEGREGSRAADSGAGAKAAPGLPAGAWRAGEPRVMGRGRTQGLGTGRPWTRLKAVKNVQRTHVFASSHLLVLLSPGPCGRSWKHDAISVLKVLLPSGELGLNDSSVQLALY